MRNFQLLMFTTVITLLLLPGPGVYVPVVAGENNAQVMFRKLEEALTKNNTILFQLQQLFLFDRKPKPCYNVEIVVEVGTLNRRKHTIFHECAHDECEYGNWTSRNNIYIVCPQGIGELQTSQVLLGYKTTSLLRILDPFFYYLITTPSIINSNDNSSGLACGGYGLTGPIPDIKMRLFLDTIDISPVRREFSDAERILLSLAKGYARTNGRLNDTQYISEISTVRRPVYCEFVLSDVLTWVFILVLAIFISANVLVLVLVMKYLQDSLCWLYTQDKEITDLYATTVAIVVLVNCLSFIARFIPISVEVHVVKNLLLIAGVVPIMVTEVAVVMYHTCRRTTTHPKTLFHRSLHFFACCHVIWFIHILVTDTIIATLNFITSPAQTVGVVSTYLSMLAGTIITLKIVLSRCKYGTSLSSKDCCKQMKQCLSLSCVLFVGISLVFLMVSVGILYIILVNYRLDTSGAGAFLLSLVQPGVVLLLGIYIKKTRLYKIFMGQDSPKGDVQVNSNAVIEMEDILQEKLASPTNWDKSVDTIHQSSSSKNITAPAQQPVESSFPKD